MVLEYFLNCHENFNLSIKSGHEVLAIIKGDPDLKKIL